MGVGGAQNISTSIFKPLITIVIICFLKINTCRPFLVTFKNISVFIGDFHACTQNLMTAQCPKMFTDFYFCDSNFKCQSSIFGNKMVEILKFSYNFHNLTFTSFWDVLWSILHFHALKRYILQSEKCVQNIEE